jgi:hypothetical protein
MPIPLVIAALSAGGTLVPHAAGGFIVSSAGGYVAGTYVSTAAVAAILTTGVGLFATGAAVATGAASAVIGSAGIFGTTVGASGLTGLLMSAGMISSTPVWVPVAVAGTALAGGGAMGYAAYQIYQIRKQVAATSEGEEAQFTENQARIFQLVLLKHQTLESTHDH